MDRLLFRSLDTLVDASALERHAFNTAFVESGLDWHWNAAQFTDLKQIIGERHRIVWYAEHVQNQCITCSSADKILWRQKQVLVSLVEHDCALPRPGVLRLLNEAAAAGIPAALAMPSTAQWPIFAQAARQIKPLATLTVLHTSAASKRRAPDSIDFNMSMNSTAYPQKLIEPCIRISSNMSGAFACINHFGEQDNPATLLSGENVLQQGNASLQSLLALEASSRATCF